jgi:type VI secretion system secreted protein VgrG
MSSSFTQEEQALTVSTPLGQDTLLATRLQGEEYLSGLFHFTLEMKSEDNQLDFDSIVGTSVTVTIALANGSQRYLNGIVGRFAQAGSDARFTTYYAELHPWLWLLTMTQDCRIFQNQSVPEIIQTVFSDLGYTDYTLSLTSTYTSRDYCVQYQESAFAFVSRLMEEEGIFYYFTHSDGNHTLVVADDTSVHTACPGLSELEWARHQHSENIVRHCTLGQHVVPNAFATDDFNFETPSTDLLVTTTGSSGTLKIYDYPGKFTKKDRGEQQASLRLDAYELPAKLLQGESYCPTLTTGYTFALTAHERADVNGTYVLRQVSHTATQQEYTNTFEAFPATTAFRPQRNTPKPTIVGLQTAMVVGKSGEEIWTDKYGRVKVQFHWDQRGARDENSSCWIRVAQGWAGKQWGSLFLPRVGQEVVVSFLNGDPDRPLITGSVYNAEQTVPYTLPDDQTKSTLKSHSSKGGDGFNEIRFEDKKDSEELFIHAQKDLQVQVLNDVTNTITQNRSTTIQQGDDTLVIAQGHRTLQVDTGNETHAVKGTRSVTVTGDETHTNEANFTQEVSGNFVLKVSGNLTLEVSGSVTIKAGTSILSQAGTSLTNKAGTSLTNTAGTTLNSSASGNVSTSAGGMQMVGANGSLVMGAPLVQLESSNPA